MSEALGQVLETLRNEKQLTQEQLSELTGISRISIGNYERGDRLPNFKALTKLSKALGVSKLYLYKVAGYLDETDILEVVVENKRLREALEYYADKSNFVEYYESDYVKFGERGITEVLKDNGKIARKALEGGE